MSAPRPDLFRASPALCSGRVAVSDQVGDTRCMEWVAPTEELLGPLNETERRYAPDELFGSGDRALLGTPCVSVVGARAASAQGLLRTRKFAALLVSRGVTVVSGLAKGIDTAAHEQAMSSGGRTIAVLGTPLGRAYPAENRGLQSRIANEHLIVSQFAPDAKTGRHSFPARNRTMALLSGATVIIDAQDESGSLHQAWEALRLGRLLYLAKSLVDDPSLEFPRELISYGAEVLEDEASVDALVSELPERRSVEYTEAPF